MAFVGNIISGGGITELPIASTTILGGVKVDGSTIVADTDGVISSLGSGGGSVSISDDNLTAGIRYISFANQTGGIASTLYTASDKLTFNPNSGTLSAVVLNTTSDRNLKSNIEKTSFGLTEIKQLDVVNFKYMASGESSTGVIAQDVQEILPDAVSVIDDVGHLGVNYSVLTAVLIKAVQELSAKVDQLSTK